MLVSIVIPCYNSEHTIEKVVDLTMQEFKKYSGYECEMILVNDYSKDATFEAIKRCSAKYPNVTGINLAKNFGQHAAIMAGLHYVNGDLVIGMDDDMQNHPSQIKQFLEKEKEGYDVIFGVFEERHFSAFKNLTGAISRKLLWSLVDRPKDIQMSSFWLAKRYVIDKALEYDVNGAFIQLLFFRTTNNIANITIKHYDREVGSSNYTFRKGLALFMSFMNYSFTPLRFATYTGVVFFLIGIVGAIVVLIRKLTNPAMQAGWPSLICTMLLLFGIVFLILGIIGEYIGKILFALNRTPQYVIRDVVGKGSAKKEQKASRPPVRIASSELKDSYSFLPKDPLKR